MRGDEPEACVTDDPRDRLALRDGQHRPQGRRSGSDRDPDHPKAERVGSRAWTHNQLSPKSLAYLAGAADGRAGEAAVGSP